MHFLSPLLSSRRLWGLALVIPLAAGLLRAKETEEPVAVFAQVFNGYTRTRLPDKSFKPETYTFGEGGCLTRPVTDEAGAEMTFLRVARAVAAPLGRLNYRPAHTSPEAELLILVFWGATEGTRGHSDPSGAVSQSGSAVSATTETAYDDDALTSMLASTADRDRIDYRNARILGYSEVFDRAKFAAHMSFAQDIMGEVANSRYYVVLQAYDFKTAVKEKKLKQLWTARISMDASGNNFGRSLDQMLQRAARYFGQDSDGLHRDLIPEGRIEIGPTKVIEPVPAK